MKQSPVSILFVTTRFDDAAVSNILCDLFPALQRAGFAPAVWALEPAPREGVSHRRAAAAGVPVHELPPGPKWNLARGVRALRRFVRQHRPALIHSHLGRADIVAALARPAEIPLVSTLHNVIDNFSRATRLGFLLTDSRVTVRTGVSRACITSMYDNWRLKSAHRVIYNPIDPARLEVARSREQVLSGLSIPPDRRVVLAAGRVIPMKGHRYLIQAMPEILRAAPDGAVVIAGEGPEREALLALARDLGVESALRMPGFTPGLPDLIAAADVVAMPSLWEGLGLVPIEAMLLRRPVVASALPPIMEYIDHEVEGLLVPPADPSALATAILRTLQQPAENAARISAAHARVTHQFNLEHITAQYVDLYRELLAR
ncbi:MAG: glycosyltransferase family 1 protein [Spirochaetaceae bacterium]|nr:MAG: glycosyltransferase family 1 protein [Spirochaetaceae bacterium]